MNFPEGFVWGTATSAHQTEGNNVNSDWWHLEHSLDTPCAESSGDACDSYHRYEDDVAIVSGLGLNSYRFSIEWCRLEPAPGEFSRAERDHYRRMIDCVKAAGLAPNITLQHFTLPRWFHEAGGWASSEAADRFARYCEFVLPLLEGVEYVCTINEPNIASSFSNIGRAGAAQGAGLPDPNIGVSDGLIRAHHAGRQVLKSVPGVKTGWSVATQVFTPLEGAESVARDYAYERETRFLIAAQEDDWLGVQAYTRTLIGPDGPLAVPENTETTLMGWEYWPQAAEAGIREAARHAPGVPLLVTENGIATNEDSRRIDYVREALHGVSAAINSGIDVRGYYYWSLLDNFEWAAGYAPAFGLVTVDRENFQRKLKPSARWFGSVATSNALPTGTHPTAIVR
jgi:beta-glucosidase